MKALQYTKAELTHQGRVRKQNEDNLGSRLNTVNGDIFVVCDGMGGHAGGQFASKMAVGSILDYLSSESFSDINQAMTDALSFANMQIYQESKRQAHLRGMGTTATITIVKDNLVYIAHVGDSRIYILSSKEGGKKLFRLTKDHSFVQQLVDQGIITDDEMETHPRKNEITRALGIRENVEPETDTAPIEPAKGDVILMCSDGLNGMVNDPTIKETLKKPQSLSDTARELINLSNMAGGKDNITVSLIKFTDSPYVRSSFKHYTPRDFLTTDSGSHNISDLFDDKTKKINRPQKTETSKKISKKFIALASLIVIALILSVAVLSAILWDKEIFKGEIITAQGKTVVFDSKGLEDVETLSQIVAEKIQSEKLNAVEAVVYVYKEIKGLEKPYKTIRIPIETPTPGIVNKFTVTGYIKKQMKLRKRFPAKFKAKIFAEEIIKQEEPKYTLVIVDEEIDNGLLKTIYEYKAKKKKVRRNDKQQQKEESKEKENTIANKEVVKDSLQKTAKPDSVKNIQNTPTNAKPDSTDRKQTDKVIKIKIPKIFEGDKRKFGFKIDSSVVIEAKYEDAKEFSARGLAWVKKDKKWFLIDPTGQAIEDAKYDDLKQIEGSSLFKVKSHGKWGIFNSEGQKIHPPMFEFIRKFKNNIALVKRGSQWSCIDKTGALKKDWSDKKSEIEK